MRMRYAIAMLAAAIGVLLVTFVAFSQGAYDASWHTVDGGGGVSTGTTFTLRGTLGQPDAQPDISASSGLTYTLSSGFWVRGMIPTVEYIINLPLVMR